MILDLIKIYRQEMANERKRSKRRHHPRRTPPRIPPRQEPRFALGPVEISGPEIVSHNPDGSTLKITILKL
jgi:hypothetical protein